MWCHAVILSISRTFQVSHHFKPFQHIILTKKLFCKPFVSLTFSFFRSQLQWLFPESSLAVTLQLSTLVILLWNPASAMLSQHLPPAGRGLPHSSSRGLVCLIHLWIPSTWHRALPLSELSLGFLLEIFLVSQGKIVLLYTSFLELLFKTFSVLKPTLPKISSTYFGW